jgi:hypothetical protein
VLKMKPQCEHCQRPLPAHESGAHICSFECTFCTDCVAELGECPNCGGQLLPRPQRAEALLSKFPPVPE